jgi:hypothetical protein
VLLAMAATIASSLAVSPVRAVSNSLTDGLVTPRTGTTQTVFAFSVRYASGSRDSPALSVQAEVAGLIVDLALVEGIATAGRWTGISGPLPAGNWPVTFRAVADGPGGNPILMIPSIVVTGPTPAPTPMSRASPSPAPTPPDTPAPTAPPPGVAPRPASASVAPTTPAAPGASVAPRSTVGGSAAGSPDLSGTGGPSETTASNDAAPRETGAVAAGGPLAGEPGDVVPDPAPSRFVWGQSAWLVLGGALTTTGLVVLGAQWFGRRPLPRWFRRR